MARKIRGIAHPAAGAVYIPETAPPSSPPSHDLLLHRAARTDAALDEVIGDEGFAFDTETLQHLADQWDDFARRFGKALRLADDLTQAEGPGLDYASVGHAETLAASGKALKAALDERVRYCEDMRDRFLTALGKYIEAEDEAETTIDKGRFE